MAPASAARIVRAPERGTEPATPLLAVDGLSVDFATEDGIFPAVRDVGFTLASGRTLGVVGESGCGKSVTALAVMGLLAQPPGRIAGGRIRFSGQDLLALSPAAMRGLRGDKLAMIFQEPMTSLNPAFTIGDQLVEAIRQHRAVGRREARERAIAMLKRVRIPSPEQRIDDYPHRLSGGMRQRVMIAMALACDPQLLIADEPTTALDVTVQAQILGLMRRLREESGMAILLISHDLGVIAEIADEVIVMYAGRIVERAPVASLFARPQHPYTIGLLGSIPRLDLDQDELPAIEGQVPRHGALGPGCSFERRCPFAEPRCREERPALRAIATGHEAACWRAPLEASVG